jgi:hypothetical protein
MQQLREKLVIAERAAKTQQQLKVLLLYQGSDRDVHISSSLSDTAFLISSGKITIAPKSRRRRTKSFIEWVLT